MTYNDLKLFIKIPTIKTSRLLLRKISKNDIFDVFEYASDPEVSKYLLWYPHVNLDFTRRYLKLIEKSYKNMDFHDWAITLSNSGKMIGTVGFTSFDIPNNNAEIGYVLNSKYWGQGIALEAAEAVINFGFETLKLNRIEAKFLPDNNGSRSVAKKCGMSFEGLHRNRILVKGKYSDVEIFDITENEYKKRKTQ